MQRAVLHIAVHYGGGDSDESPFGSSELAVVVLTAEADSSYFERAPELESA